jgi:hypothetical protein
MVGNPRNIQNENPLCRFSPELQQKIAIVSLDFSGIQPFKFPAKKTRQFSQILHYSHP